MYITFFGFLLTMRLCEESYEGIKCFDFHVLKKNYFDFLTFSQHLFFREKQTKHRKSRNHFIKHKRNI